MSNEKIKHIVGQRVKHYRKMKSLTQKQLAADVGVAPSFIANIEQGQKGVSIEKMVDICEWFNVGLSDLLPIETQNDMEIKEKIIEEIAKSLRTLETTKVRLLKTMIDGVSIHTHIVEN